MASKLRILTEKGVFLGPNIREKGLFSKLENADMSSFIVLSEGAGGVMLYVQVGNRISMCNVDKNFTFCFFKWTLLLLMHSDCGYHDPD